MTTKATLIALTAVLASLALSAPSASAETPCSGCKPWWHLTSSATPTNLAPEGKGQIVITATNLGDASVKAETATVRIADTLPSGLHAVAIEGLAGVELAGSDQDGPVSCELSSLTCTFAGTVPPYDQIEVVIGVAVGEAAVSGEVNQVDVTGGGAASASLDRPITVSGEPTPFGLQDNELAVETATGPGGAESGAPAGSHPFQVTSTLISNARFAPGRENVIGKNGVREAWPEPVALPKDLSVKLPPGAVGNPRVTPLCTLLQFDTKVGSHSDGCSPQTAVGVASVHLYEPTLQILSDSTVPIFNLEPSFGEPARFGFYIPFTETPVTLDASLRGGPGSGEEYAVTVGSQNVPQTIGLVTSELTFWGVPGDVRHDSSRGWGCLALSKEKEGSCAATEAAHPPAFITLPTSCPAVAPVSSTVFDSWDAPGDLLTAGTTDPLPLLAGCNQLAFSPTIAAEPSTDSASSASGLNFDLNFDDEGLLSAEGAAQSQLKDTTVTLPEGFTINPSSGVGLGGCTPTDFAAETIGSAPGAGCPNDSTLGEVTLETPLLAQKLHGSIYIAQPYENPFDSLVALYIVVKDPETGILVKLAGKVTPNPVTGQLVTTFENNPQLPFSHFNFHFREGARAPLITPSTCGTYTTLAALTPWSEPASALTDTSSFQITHGVGGGPCPAGGVPPFNPQITAGLLHNNAGAFSPFYLHLTRTDAEQEISGFSTNLPPGLTGSLTGIPFCPEADIALARTKSGAQEEASPSCPAASQVGHTLVGAGVGAVLAYVPGKVYLAGPFHGAPFSLVSVTSAVVGPFDLGTVVLRFGLNIDPYTAQVSVSPTTSEPIPTIIQGIVTHVRDIRVYIERPGNAPFTLNPTSCAPMAIDSTLTASEGASATVTSPFQAASCANLKFAPKFVVSTSGKTSRAKGASLHVDLTYPQGPAGTYANIAKVKVELPKQLPSRLTTLQKACTAAQFNTNPAGCPTPSVIGSAKAVVPNIPVPLEGPVYFVSHGGEAFPSLEIVLQGYGVKIILVGATFISKSGVTSTTFKAIPDNPVTSFELTLPEGKYSALAANGNLCTQKLVMPADFTAQNGATSNQKTPITVTGCKKTKTLTRAQKLTKALKACHKKPKGKRAACEAQARKQFGPVKKGKKK
jgi:hypothetical protein